MSVHQLVLWSVIGYLVMGLVITLLMAAAASGPKHSPAVFFQEVMKEIGSDKNSYLSNIFRWPLLALYAFTLFLIGGIQTALQAKSKKVHGG